MAPIRRNSADREGHAALLREVQLPLENIAFTLDQHLLANAPQLDLETRILLAGIRDSIDRVAEASRRLQRPETEAA